MPEIYCKGDCTFSDNERRLCKLELVELQQAQEGSPQFNCSQYVKRQRPENKYITTDQDRARAAGVWDAMRMKLK